MSEATVTVNIIKLVQHLSVYSHWSEFCIGVFMNVHDSQYSLSLSLKHKHMLLPATYGCLHFLPIAPNVHGVFFCSGR